MDAPAALHLTDAAAWAAAGDPARRVGRRVEHHALIGSTNDRARDALRQAGGDELAIVADAQSAGRGRRGREWLSPPGVNLMLSVPLRTELRPPLAGLLGIGAALAVRDACAQVVPLAGLVVRWPNDVVAADGSKLAGLLVETALEDGALVEAVIGIGINVNWPRAGMPAEIRARATSLLELAGAEVDRVALLAGVLDALAAEVLALEAGRSPVPRLRSVSWLDGRLVELDMGEARASGRVAGIADDGSLLLDGNQGRVACSVGEIARVLDAAPVVRA
jgi:BirA family biotin operon repressor/biotin-[acetyl-CoA-carboxylase] ligase